MAAAKPTTSTNAYGVVYAIISPRIGTKLTKRVLSPTAQIDNSAMPISGSTSQR